MRFNINLPSASAG